MTKVGVSVLLQLASETRRIQTCRGVAKEPPAGDEPGGRVALNLDRIGVRDWFGPEAAVAPSGVAHDGHSASRLTSVTRGRTYGGERSSFSSRVT